MMIQHLDGWGVKFVVIQFGSFLERICGDGLMVYVLLFMSVLSIEYNRIIVFKEPIPGRVLPDHVIRTEKVLNEGGCRVKCFLEPKCVFISVSPGGAHTPLTRAFYCLRWKRRNITFTFKLQYPHTNSPNWSPCISFKSSWESLV